MISSPLRPLHDYLVIDKDPLERTSDAGLVLQLSAKSDNVKTGTVLAVGPGVEIDGKHDEMVVKPGDRVMFSPGTGSTFEHDKKKYLFLKQRDIMGLLR